MGDGHDEKKFRNRLKKKYDFIREKIRPFLAYGELSKEDLIKRNLVKSMRNADIIIDILDNILYKDDYDPKKDRQRNKEGKYKYRYTFDYIDSQTIDNILKSYKYSTYNENEIIIYFLILSRFLSEFENDCIDDNNKDNIYDEFLKGDELYTEDEIITLIEDIDDGFNYRSIKKVIEDMKDIGILIGDTKGIKISKGIFDNIDRFEELETILKYMEFYQNTTFFITGGYFTRERLTKYLIHNYGYKENIKKLCDDKIIFNNIRVSSIFDDDIKWNLINAIKKRKFISFDIKTKDGLKDKIDSKKAICPIKLILETYYNREYLFYYDTIKNQYYMVRLDEIYNLNVDKKAFNIIENKEILDDKDIDDIYYNKMKYTWNVNLQGSLYRLKLKFNFPHDNYDYFFNRLELTGKNGDITKGKNGVVFYEKDVLVSEDTKVNYEFIPWLHSWGNYVTVLNDDEFGKIIKKMLVDDCISLLKFYEEQN